MPHRIWLLLIILGLLAACAQPATTTPTAVPTSAPTAVQAPTPTPLSPEAALLATMAAAGPAEPTPTPIGPTPLPTITLAPTVPPSPLPAGWWDNAVCYQVFVRSFADSNGDGIGDLPGLIERLDYINDGDPDSRSDLGATCIWLMPIMAATSYHGYDTTDYYRVEPDYGTNEDFTRLVEQARQRGIRIILDLVLNHTGIEHPDFRAAFLNPDSPKRTWYIFAQGNPGFLSPWGGTAWHPAANNETYYGIFWSGMPDLNYRNPDVTQEAYRISAFWLNDMGADGFRLDAIKHVIENGREQENTRETHAWLREYARFLKQTKPESFTVGEVFDSRPTVLAAYYPDQLDSYFEFGVGEGIIGAANTGLADSYLDAVMTAYEQLPFQRWAPFLSNHDQVRVINRLNGDPARMRVAAFALLTLPGLPFVYYGEEIGMAGAKPDERLRTPMQWENAPGLGFTTSTPWQLPQTDLATANVALQNEDPDSLLNLYRQLIHLHTSTPALGQGDFLPLTVEGSASVAAFLRRSGDSNILVLINFGTRPTTSVRLSVAASGLPPGSYTLRSLLDSMAGAPLVAGPNGAISLSVPVELAAQQGWVFAIERVP